MVGAKTKIRILLIALSLSTSSIASSLTSSIYLGNATAIPGRTATIPLNVLEENVTYQIHCELKTIHTNPDHPCGYVTVHTELPDGTGRDFSHRMYVDGEEIITKGGYFHFNPKGSYFEMNNVNVNHGVIEFINMCWTGNLSVSNCYARPW